MNLSILTVAHSACKCIHVEGYIKANMASGGVSAVKEPGHFEVRKSSSQVTGVKGVAGFSPGVHFLPRKKLTTFLCLFSRCPQNTGRQRLWLFHCQNKANKAVRYGDIFIFCSHCYRSKAIARAVDLLARSFDLPRPRVALPQNMAIKRLLNVSETKRLVPH